MQKQRLTNAIVELHKELLGRGPVDARTHVSEDAVVCLLKGGFSRDELTLVRAGHADAVIARRRAVVEAMADRFSAAVAELAGRPVVCHLSDCDPEMEVVAEVFILGPPSSDLNAGDENEGLTAQGHQARRRSQQLKDRSQELRSRSAAEAERIPKAR